MGPGPGLGHGLLLGLDSCMDMDMDSGFSENPSCRKRVLPAGRGSLTVTMFLATSGFLISFCFFFHVFIDDVMKHFFDCLSRNI